MLSADVCYLTVRGCYVSPSGSSEVNHLLCVCLCYQVTVCCESPSRTGKVKWGQPPTKHSSSLINSTNFAWQSAVSKVTFLTPWATITRWISTRTTTRMLRGVLPSRGRAGGITTVRMRCLTGTTTQEERILREPCVTAYTGTAGIRVITHLNTSPWHCHVTKQPP